MKLNHTRVGLASGCYFILFSTIKLMPFAPNPNFYGAGRAGILNTEELMSIKIYPSYIRRIISMDAVSKFGTECFSTQR